MTRYTRLSTAEHYAAEQGYALTADDWQAILAAQKQATARKTAMAEPDQGRRALIQKFNRWYPRLLKSLHGTGDVALTFVQTLIVAFGVAITLVLLLIVEQERVQGGIGLFEANAAFAAFAAWAMVILNLVIEFVIEHIETKANYHPDPATRFSLRTVARTIRYITGFLPNWKPIANSPAQRFRSLRRIVTLAILALALAGSMRDVIASTSGAWYDALLAVLTRSTLSQAATWVVGLAFALTSVLSAQGLSRYVAVRCVEILTAMNAVSSQEKQVTQAEIEGAAAQYVIATVNKWQSEQAAVELAKSPSLPNLAAIGNLATAPKPRPKFDKTVEFFRMNPTRANEPERDLATELDVSKETVRQARQAFSSNGNHTNGV